MLGKIDHNKIEELEKKFNVKIDKKYLNKVKWNIFRGEKLKVI